MQKLLLNSLFLAIALVFTISKANAHCEVPCGIYDDSVRVALIKEHIGTIEKAMVKITEESAKEKPNYNQLVRWVNNKEEHAKKIQEIVSQYFLHQRIKLVDPTNAAAYKKYQTHLELLHKLLVYAMKCKQTTDKKYIADLRTTITAFEKAYFHKH